MKKLMLLTVALLTIAHAAQAEERLLRTVPSSRPAVEYDPFGQPGYKKAKEERDAKNYSVKDMSPTQRALYWSNLSDEDKQRVMERRAEVEQKRMEDEKWSSMTDEEKAAQTKGLAQKPMPAPVPTATPAPEPQAVPIDPVDVFKAKWQAMTPDEKKAYVQSHGGFPATTK